MVVFTVRNDVLSGGQEFSRFKSNLSLVLKRIDVTESFRMELVEGGVVTFDDTSYGTTVTWESISHGT